MGNCIGCIGTGSLNSRVRCSSIKKIRQAWCRGFASCALNLGKNCVFALCLILFAAPSAHLPNKKRVQTLGVLHLVDATSGAPGRGCPRGHCSPCGTASPSLGWVDMWRGGGIWQWLEREKWAPPTTLKKAQTPSRLQCPAIEAAVMPPTSATSWKARHTINGA
jgi:hypothetical protein